jgi:pyruvate formate lyase activating enzyme
MARCDVCFRHCEIEEGKKGFCKARTCLDGEVIPFNYGRITSLALDPIEKKPLRRFYPGSKIISIGSFGCNLRCPFCQNDSISWSDEVLKNAEMSEYISPEELVNIALRYYDKGLNCGIAYTYNEPLIGYEYVRDCAKLAKDAGLVNVLVTNGTAAIPILEELLPFIDAMNIDLKGFTEDYYNKTLGGNFIMTLSFIERAVKDCHVELTTLIVPGENDSDDEMINMCKWIAALKDSSGKTIGEDIPLHISRFFPRFHMQDKNATDVSLVYHLKDVADDYLKYVYTGNC